MEVNKEQAEKCRDLGAEAMRRGDYSKACRMLNKSLQLYPLPGVEALLNQAQRRASSSSSSSSANGRSSSNNNASSSSSSSSSTTPATPAQPQQPSQQQTGSGGRPYTDEQVKIVKDVLKSREGGRGAHYRVLGLQPDCNESEIKKAYRKISLKVHPDKNAAPKADEAFKAVGLAYATLSDEQKRTIYDRYGDEDPDNRGGGGGGGGFRRGRGGGVHMNGQEVSPEDIFNMFFGMNGPGMGGGGPGVRVYTTGFGGPGGGFHFQQGMPGRQRQRGNGQGGGQGGDRQPRPPSLWNMIVNFMPMLIIMLISFSRFGEDMSSQRYMPGEQKYFSLTQNYPFLQPLQTKYSSVKDIPYFVSEKFMRTYHRDRYQLAQVERMVEAAYENYLKNECQSERKYMKQLKERAENEREPTRRKTAMKQADAFHMQRCDEWKDLFPKSKHR